MSTESEPTYWFVGAAIGATEDKTDEMVKGGFWQYWPGGEKPNKYKDHILSMQPGDKIAIKAAYVRKNNLPFDNRGRPVSVMAIKAIGEITENPRDGETVKVDWEKRFDPPREWYFYTGRTSVWRLNLNRWYSKALVAFAFEEEDQDINLFRNEPYWRNRFGDEVPDSRFAWTGFYEAFASRLLEFENRRGELLEGLRELSESGQVPNLGYFYEKGPDDSRIIIDDICPFTFIGAFNRGGTVDNRRSIAAALAKLIGLDRPVPEGFDGIPVLNSQRSWFFAYKENRNREDIDRLWSVFKAALSYVDEEEEKQEIGEMLAELYDKTVQQRGVGWNLSMGLYWIRPWDFLPLDKKTRTYLQNQLDVEAPLGLQYDKLTGSQYLNLVEDLKGRFEEDPVSVGSFPEISYKAFQGGQPPGSTTSQIGHEPSDSTLDPPESYALDSIVEEGCFFPRHDLERMLKRLVQKKNIILQGSPGTGKTWLSKRLAYALIGTRAPAQVVPLQFHPTLSYEDFVRGWRPSSGGTLELVDGPLMQTIAMARENPDSRFVVVIEEINRGSPAQIFGEMLTLLEADKRAPDQAMRLSHMRENEDYVYVPPNLYVIGTMNIADRSLALVDLALRRRFAFFELEPQFNDAWANWVMQYGGFEIEHVRDIRARMLRLNDTIANDDALGPQFRVGHSYVTPRAGGEIGTDARQWFRDVVQTEIGPLLEEYWFDRTEEAMKQVEKLLEGW